MLKTSGPAERLYTLPERSEPCDVGYRSFDLVQKIRHGKIRVSLTGVREALRSKEVVFVLEYSAYPNVTALRQIS